MFQRIISAFVAQEILDRKDHEDYERWSSVSNYIHNAVVPLLKSWLERRGQTRPSALISVVRIEVMRGISRAAERAADILEGGLDADSAIGRLVVDALDAVACMSPLECDIVMPNFAVDAVATEIRERFGRDVELSVGATPTHRILRVIAKVDQNPDCSGNGPKEG